MTSGVMVHEPRRKRRLARVTSGPTSSPARQAEVQSPKAETLPPDKKPLAAMPPPIVATVAVPAAVTATPDAPQDDIAKPDSTLEAKAPVEKESAAKVEVHEAEEAPIAPVSPATEPSQRLCAAFDEALESAQERLWLAIPWVYTRDDNPWLLDFMGRVAAAKRRGLDVRAYMRPDPYNTYAASLWREAGVTVVQDTPRARYLHTKLIVTEKLALLSTANLTDTDLFRNANDVTLIHDPLEVAEKASSIELLGERIETATDKKGVSSDAVIPEPLRPYITVKRLNPMQAGAIPLVMQSTKNLVISAPTGAGKTLVAEAALLKEATINKRLGIYLVPMRAIASEKRDDWKRLEEQGLTIYKTTGEDDAFDPAQALAADIMVTTPERLDAVSRRTLPPALVAKIGTIVIDEVHLVDEAERGPVLEALLTRIHLTFPAARLVAMSGTITNGPAIAAWLEADLYESSWRPIALVHAVIPYEETGSWQRDEDLRNTITARIVAETLEEGAATLVFCGSRKSVESCATYLADALACSSDPPIKQVDNAVLAHTLGCGVGFHHAGLSSASKRAAENAFRSGAIKVLVATSTVAAGVNLPARVVVVRDLSLGLNEISSPVLLQMAGRAGRPGKETEGRCFVIAPHTKMAQVERDLRGRPLQSRLGEDLTTYINTEIALGIIRRRHDAQARYSHTLHAHIGGKTADIDAALTTLIAGKFVDDLEGMLTPTALGIATSDAMISVATAQALDDFVSARDRHPTTATELEREILMAACGLPVEFTKLPAYHSEEDLLMEIAGADPRLKEWPLGRVRYLAVAASMLSGLPVEDMPIESAATAVASVQNDLPRFLRFIGRRAMEIRPSVPALMVAASDLALALEFGLAHRGTSLLIEALRRVYPPNGLRRRQIIAEYERLRGEDVTSLEAAPPYLPPSAQSFISFRPRGPLTLDVVDGELVGRTPSLGYTVQGHIMLQVAGQQRYVYLDAVDAREMPLSQIDALGPPGRHCVTVEAVLVSTSHRVLWNYTSTQLELDIPPPPIDYAAVSAALAAHNVPPQYEQRGRPHSSLASLVQRLRLAVRDVNKAPDVPLVELEEQIAQPPANLVRAAAILQKNLRGPADKVQAVRTLLAERRRSTDPERLPRPLLACQGATSITLTEAAMIAAALLKSMGVASSLVEAFIDDEFAALCIWQDDGVEYGLPIWDAQNVQTVEAEVHAWEPPTEVRPSPAAAPLWASISSYLSIGPRELPHTLWVDPITEDENLNQVGPACPQCGSTMKEREGPYSLFWGCTRYPACTGRVPLTVDALR